MNGNVNSINRFSVCAGFPNVGSGVNKLALVWQPACAI